MKRTYIAIILLLIAGILCTTEFLYVNNSAKIITESIEKSRDLYSQGKKDDALKYAKKAEKNWNSRVNKIDMLLFHDYVDDITRDILNIRTCIEDDDSTGVFTTCNDALSRISSLKKSELPTTDNII